MYKKVFGSTDLLIDINRKFYDNYKNTVNVFLQKNKDVELILFGKLTKINIEKLFLLSWFEVESLIDSENQIDNIVFYKASHVIRTTTGFIMQFKEPVYYKENFRYVPSYSRYAINLQSDLIDTFTNQIVTSREVLDGYECAYIRSPEKSKNANIRIHRLLALAWLPNDDFVNRPIINHIDGNKINNTLPNLEWCSYTHNSNHALDTGLNNTRIMMKTRDIVTGKVEVYKSVIELTKKIVYGGRSSLDFENKLPGYLYNKRYEIKKFEDNTPWFYENSDFEPTNKRALYTIKALDKETGEIITFSSVETFKKHYKIHNLKDNYGLESSISLLKEKNPNIDVTYIRNAMKGPYYLHDVVDKKLVIFQSMKSVAEHIGIGLNEISLDATRKYKFIYQKRWIINWSPEYNLDEYVHKDKLVKKVLIINTNNNTEMIADSMKHAARLTGTEFRTVLFRIESGTPYKGYIFKRIED